MTFAMTLTIFLAIFLARPVFLLGPFLPGLFRALGFRGRGGSALSSRFHAGNLVVVLAAGRATVVVAVLAAAVPSATFAAASVAIIAAVGAALFTHFDVHHLRGAPVSVR